MHFNAANALELSFCFEFTTTLLRSHTSASELEIFVVDLLIRVCRPSGNYPSEITKH